MYFGFANEHITKNSKDVEARLPPGPMAVGMIILAIKRLKLLGPVLLRCGL